MREAICHAGLSRSKSSLNCVSNDASIISKYTHSRHTCSPQNDRLTYTIRHRASTSMYSLTFCVLVMLPERHHWKPAVQAAAVMLRTFPSTASHRPASHAHFPYTERNFENAPCHPPVTGQQRAQTPPSVRTMSSDRRMDASL